MGLSEIIDDNTPWEGDVPLVPHVTYGRTKSGRSDVKQVQFGLDILKDGGVPVALTPLDGNTAEARTDAANLKQLHEMFPRTRLLSGV